MATTKSSSSKTSSKAAAPRKATTEKKNVEVSFEYFAPEAKAVVLAGSFNNWDQRRVTLAKNNKGQWTAVLELAPGRYEYRYVVDGCWCNDQKRRESVANPYGSSNSVIEVK